MSVRGVPSPGRLGELYRTSFDDPRRERMFLSGVSFFVTFAAIRAVTGVQRRTSDQSSGKGQKVHHYVYGILMLLATGYSWLFLGGRDESPHRTLARSTTIVYGTASALTIDEFNIWLHVKNNYWKSPMRQVIDATILSISMLSICSWGWPFFSAVRREMTSQRSSAVDPDAPAAQGLSVVGEPSRSQPR